MNREVHVRFWESPEVKVLRATRPSHRFDAAQQFGRFLSEADKRSRVWCCGGYVSGDLRPIGSPIRNPACRPEASDGDSD
jgi:hypothetical protein